MRFHQENSAPLREFNLCVSKRRKGAKKWVNKSEKAVFRLAAKVITPSRGAMGIVPEIYIT
jgi:hypothetical protein